MESFLFLDDLVRLTAYSKYFKYYEGKYRDVSKSSLTMKYFVHIPYLRIKSLFKEKDLFSNFESYEQFSLHLPYKLLSFCSMLKFFKENKHTVFITKKSRKRINGFIDKLEKYFIERSKVLYSEYDKIKNDKVRISKNKIIDLFMEMILHSDKFDLDEAIDRYSKIIKEYGIYESSDVIKDFIDDFNEFAKNEFEALYYAFHVEDNAIKFLETINEVNKNIDFTYEIIRNNKWR